MSILSLVSKYPVCCKLNQKLLGLSTWVTTTGKVCPSLSLAGSSYTGSAYLRTVSSGGNTELTTLLPAKVSNAIRSESSPTPLVSLRVPLLGLILTATFSSARSSTLALASEHSKLFMLGWPESPGSRWNNLLK